MGRINRNVLCFMAIACGAGLASADGLAGEPLLGVWLTQDGDARIRIERCPEGLCGSIVWMADPVDANGAELRDTENPDPDLRDRRVHGLTILRIDDVPDENGVWRGGRIYDPKTGRTYRCTLRKDGADAVKMRGFLGITLLGRTTRWTRAEHGDDPAGPLVTDGG